MKITFSKCAKIILAVNLCAIFLSIVTGFSREVVFEMPFIGYYIFCLLIAILGIFIGNKLRFNNVKKLKIFPRWIDKAIENKSNYFVFLILLIQTTYLINFLSSLENLPDIVAGLFKLDFYSLRYELATNLTSRQWGVDRDRSLFLILKTFEKIFLFIIYLSNGYFISHWKNTNRDRIIFIPLTFLYFCLTIYKGSRTGFVQGIVAFLVGLIYSKNLQKNIIEENLLENKKIFNQKISSSKIFERVVIIIITISFLIIGKITSDRVGRVDVKSVWLERYVVNVGASTELCNKLCENPIIAGASGYTVGPYLYSKSEFNRQLKNNNMNSGFGLGYKSFWFPHQIISRIPFINKITKENKNNWNENLISYQIRNRLKRSAWRGLVHDYIFDWGLFFAPFTIFFSYSFLGYVEGLGKRSKGFKSLLCTTISVLMSILSIATTPFGPLLPLALLAIIL